MITKYPLLDRRKPSIFSSLFLLRLIIDLWTCEFKSIAFMLLKQGIQYFNNKSYNILNSQFFSSIWHALSSGRHKMFTASCDQLDGGRKISGEAQNTLFGWKGAFVNTKKSNNSNAIKE